MFKLTNLTKKYGKRVVINNLTFRFPKTGLVLISGPSGCGKTTLLNILAGLDVNFEGQCQFQQQSLQTLSEEERSIYRLKNIGYIFQDYRLFEIDTVFDNLLLPLEIHTYGSKEVIKRHIDNCLELVDLSHKTLSKINVLSGGEKQRVGIARALINDPMILLCDEPTGSLDEENGFRVLEILKTLSQSRLVIIVSHDEKMVTPYCVIKLSLFDGRMIKVETFPSTISNKKRLKSKITKNKPDYKMPLKAMLRRSLAILKARKFRLIINNVMMSLGLFGIGLSIIMTSSIQERIVRSFSEVMNDQRIVMSQSQAANPLLNVYSASIENVTIIKEKYSNYLEEIGVSYQVNFENFFKDGDEFFVSSTTYKIVLPRFTTRQINDYHWYNYKDSQLVVYPRQDEKMADDDIIIGLNYNDMVGLCYSLRILRDYVSLGAYLSSEDVLITLAIANNDWQYEDEQIFRLKGVVETQEPMIFHSNFRWNEWVFEEKMRLPSIDGGKYIFPWQINKTYYLKPKFGSETFLELALEEKALQDYIFQSAGRDEHPTHCRLGRPCILERLLVYHVDKTTIETANNKKIIDYEKRLKSYIYTSDGGYYYHPNSFLAGFAKNVYVSLSPSQIEMAVDADTMVANESSNIAFDPPKGVLQGSIHTSLSGGVNFSSNLREVIIGRAPQSLDEIVISEGLAHQLLSPREMIGKTLHLAVNYNNIIYNNDMVEKEYSLIEVTIVGVAKGNHIALHHRPFWAIGFFHLKAGISAFELIPTHIIFEIDEAQNSDEIIARLQNRFKDYLFTNPMQSMKEGIDDTLAFINIALIAFSSLAILISLFLFFIVMYVTIEENRKDITLMHYLGVQRKEIRKSFIICGLVVSSLGFLMSSFEIIVADFVVTHIIEGYLGTNIAYVFNPKPVITTLVLSIVIAVASSFMAFEQIYKKRKKQID